MFLVLCLLVNGELQCTEYQDSERQVFKKLTDCEKSAEYRFYTMTDSFLKADVPFETIQIGCQAGEES
jgi:hypothetical protein